MAGWKAAEGGPMDQHQVPEVDKRSDALTGDEDRVLPVDCVGQRDKSARQAHVPKSNGYPALSAPFGRQPLDDPSHEKDPLSDESDREPKCFSDGHDYDAGFFLRDVRNRFEFRRLDNDSAGIDSASIAPQ